MIDDGHVEPGIVRPKPGRPDDRADRAIPQIDFQRCGGIGSRGIESLDGIDLGSDPGSCGPLVERGQHSIHLEICERTDVVQRSGELCLAIANPHESTADSDAIVDQPIQVEIGMICRAGKLGRRQAPYSCRVVDLLETLIENAGHQHPPLNIPATIQARHAYMLPDRQGDRSAAGMNFVCELQAGC